MRENGTGQQGVQIRDSYQLIKKSSFLGPILNQDFPAHRYPISFQEHFKIIFWHAEVLITSLAFSYCNLYEFLALDLWAVWSTAFIRSHFVIKSLDRLQILKCLINIKRSSFFYNVLLNPTIHLSKLS